jgi:hypothetical protein
MVLIWGKGVLQYQADDSLILVVRPDSFIRGNML